MGVILYGGAFDPPHDGHLSCLRALRHHYPSAKIIVLPMPSLTSDKRCCAPFFHRRAMIKLIFPHYCTISSIEVRRRFTQSKDTVDLFKKRYPKDNLGLAIGDDQLRAFTRWQGWRPIVRQAGLIVLPRNIPKSESKRCAHHLQALEKKAMPITLLAMEKIKISSTQLRAALLDRPNARPPPRLPSAVARYIVRHHLYQQGA